MISSNEQQKMVEACIRAGADSYLFKPLRIADFSNIWQVGHLPASPRISPHLPAHPHLADTDRL